LGAPFPKGEKTHPGHKHTIMQNFTPITGYLSPETYRTRRIDSLQITADLISDKTH